jgi:hypothetical protein
MAQSIAEALLWLFVMNLGIAFGVGIYEAKIIAPQWARSPPESVIRSPARVGHVTFRVFEG